MDKGVVSVFGGIPGDRKIGIPGKRIGYMPQVITNLLPIINIYHKFEAIFFDYSRNLLCTKNLQSMKLCIILEEFMA